MYSNIKWQSSTVRNRNYFCTNLNINPSLHAKWVLLGCSALKHLPANAGDTGLIPSLERSPGGGKDNPLQYFCLHNSTDRGASWATVHGVTKSWTQLSN